MSVQEQRAAVRRILASAQFQRALKLRGFLELVCEYYFQGRSAEINEHLVATQAFGKGPEFNPGEDSLVRVQARELRRRLHEYYEGEGKGSITVLDIPPGQYAPVFRNPVEATESAVPRKPVAQRASWLILAGTVLACAVLLIAADRERRLIIRSTTLAANLERPTPAPSVAGLWNRFLQSDAPTLLVVSSPEVDECGGRKGGAAGCTDEQYTGMGEAVAVHLITTLFRSSRQPLIVKPSRIVTADDVKRYNLVLLGGKSVNIWTLRLGADLSLSEPEQPPGYATVLDPHTGQVTRDRGIVALRRNAATGRWMLFLWGHHSQGTHAAAEVSTDERFLAQLKWPATPFPDSFHVLLSVEVNDGVPARALPAAVRVP